MANMTAQRPPLRQAHLPRRLEHVGVPAVDELADRYNEAAAADMQVSSRWAELNALIHRAKARQQAQRVQALADGAGTSPGALAEIAQLEREKEALAPELRPLRAVRQRRLDEWQVAYIAHQAEVGSVARAQLTAEVAEALPILDDLIERSNRIRVKRARTRTEEVAQGRVHRTMALGAAILVAGRPIDDLLRQCRDVLAALEDTDETGDER